MQYLLPAYSKRGGTDSIIGRLGIGVRSDRRFSFGIVALYMPGRKNGSGLLTHDFGLHIWPL